MKYFEIFVVTNTLLWNKLVLNPIFQEICILSGQVSNEYYKYQYAYEYAYLGPSQTCENKPLIISTKSSIIGVWQGPKYLGVNKHLPVFCFFNSTVYAGLIQNKSQQHKSSCSRLLINEVNQETSEIHWDVK